MKLFIGISVTAALLAGTLIVSCSPLPEAYPKNQTSNNSANSDAISSVITAETQMNALDGDWVCASDNGCTYSRISISAKEGTATLNGDSNQTAKVEIGNGSKTDRGHLHLSISTLNETLRAELSIEKDGNKLILHLPADRGDEEYTRKTFPSVENFDNLGLVTNS